MQFELMLFKGRLYFLKDNVKKSAIHIIIAYIY